MLVNKRRENGINKVIAKLYYDIIVDYHNL